MKSAILNLAFLAGACAAFVGMWWLAPWVALVVFGAASIGLSVLGHLRGAK